jgi:monovalent cation:H+ antiporter-2, CPA2 family
MLSIIFNPFVFMLFDKLIPKPPPTPPEPVLAPEPVVAPVTQRAVIVGFGRVGSRIGRQLEQRKIAYAVVEEREEVIERLLEANIPTITGNGASVDVLRAAALDKATLIYITVPDGFEAGRVVELARQINPAIRIMARSHSDAEAEHLAGRGADIIISGEEEIAQAMIDATGAQLAGA